MGICGFHTRGFSVRCAFCIILVVLLVAERHIVLIIYSGYCAYEHQIHKIKFLFCEKDEMNCLCLSLLAS